MDFNGTWFAQLAGVGPPGATLYVADTDSGTQEVNYRSVLSYGSCIDIGSPLPSQLYPAVAIVDLEALFTPPFRIVEVPQ